MRAIGTAAHIARRIVATRTRSAPRAINTAPCYTRFVWAYRRDATSLLRTRPLGATQCACESYASSLPRVLIVSTRLCRTRANGVAHRPRYFSAARPWILLYRGAACALIRSGARTRRAIRAFAMSVVRTTWDLRSRARRDNLITRYGAVGLPRDGERQSCNLKVLGSIPVNVDRDRMCSGFGGAALTHRSTLSPCAYIQAPT